MSDSYNPGNGFTRMSSPYGWRILGGRSEFHAGQDFSAPEGTRIPSAASGVVVYSGKNEGGYGNLVIVKNDTGSSSVYAHMRGDDQVKPGQRVWPGDTLGRVGNTGRSEGAHLHYSVITEQASKTYDPAHPLAGGPMGLHLDDSNTYDPAEYHNYVLPAPPYLGESRRAAEIMSGLDEKSLHNGGVPPDRPGNPVFNPFNPVPAAGFVPLPNAPAGTDDPANFADRFGKWAAKPFGEIGNIGAPAPQVAPNAGKRSEADDDAPVRVLSIRGADLSAAPASGEAPSLAPASAPPLLGIVSGQPTREHPLPPSIFAADNRSSPDDDELYQRWRRWLDA